MPADPTEEAPPQVPKTELDELQIKAQGVADEVYIWIFEIFYKIFKNIYTNF